MPKYNSDPTISKIETRKQVQHPGKNGKRRAHLNKKINPKISIFHRKKPMQAKHNTILIEWSCWGIWANYNLILQDRLSIYIKNFLSDRKFHVLNRSTLLNFHNQHIIDITVTYQMLNTCTVLLVKSLFVEGLAYVCTKLLIYMRGKWML